MSNPTNPFNWQMPQPTDLVTDLPADFEVFGQAVATSMADLLGGTTGQILSKASNTDMDFTWIANDQGDITGVTASSPLTGGGTSGAITVGIQDGTTAQKGAVQLENSTSSTSTTTAAVPASVKSAYDLANGAIPKSLVDAAGDLIVGTSNDTVGRLAIGTANQVLKVNSGATALEWGTAASGGGLTLLSTTTLSGSSTTISSISGSYKNLKIVLRNVYASANTSLLFRVNGSSASYTWAGTANVSSSSTVIGGGYNTSSFQISYNMTTSVNGLNWLYGVIEIPRYSESQTPFIESNVYFGVTDSSRQSSTGIWDNNGPITSVTFLPGTGTFSGGTVYIYGES